MRWHKRQFACIEQRCTRKAFTESAAEIQPRARVRGRLCQAVARQVASGRSVAAVGRDNEMGWPLMHRHFAVHADTLLIEPEPPRVLSIDETRRGRPKWIKNEATGRWVRTELFETNFVDLSGPGWLLGQAAGRTGKAVVDWLNARGQDWRSQVRVVAIDPAACYRTAIKQALPMIGPGDRYVGADDRYVGMSVCRYVGADDRYVGTSARMIGTSARRRG